MSTFTLPPQGKVPSSHAASSLKHWLVGFFLSETRTVTPPEEKVQLPEASLWRPLAGLLIGRRFCCSCLLGLRCRETPASQRTVCLSLSAPQFNSKCLWHFSARKRSAPPQILIPRRRQTPETPELFKTCAVYAQTPESTRTCTVTTRKRVLMASADRPRGDHAPSCFR